VLIGNRTTVVFSATTAEFGYGNFEPAPLKPPAGGGSFLTIWESGGFLRGLQNSAPARVDAA